MKNAAQLLIKIRDYLTVGLYSARYKFLSIGVSYVN